MKLTYIFNEPLLHKQALTHKSAGSYNNERLEFLGDALVNNIIAEAIYLKFPRADEGEMSRLRAMLVRQESLAEVARALQLGDQLLLGSGELKSGGYRRESILADALEALVAAIYLDSNSDTCKQEVLRWFAEKLNGLSLQEEQRDYKTRLQEWLQSRKHALPVYETLEESGADHERQFVIRCIVGSLKQQTLGEGSSKKQAEQNAAALMLAGLQTGQKV